MKQACFFLKKTTMLAVFASLGIYASTANAADNWIPCYDWFWHSWGGDDGGVSYRVTKLIRKGTTVAGQVCANAGHKATATIKIGNSSYTKTANALKQKPVDMTCENFSFFGPSSSYSVSCSARAN